MRSGRRWLARALTPTGWLAFSGFVVALPVAAIWGWAEAGAIAAVSAVAIVVAVLFVLGHREYHVDLAMVRDRVVVGDDTTGSVVVTNVGRRVALPGRVEIPMGDALAVIDIPLLRPGSAHTAKLALPTDRRSVVPVGPVRAVRADPLSLLRIETVWPQTYTLFVHPVTTAVPATNAGFIRDLEGNPTSAIADDDISFHALREYAPGDSMRHIHWKATARAGTLMVRQFEQTRRSRIAVVLSLCEQDFAEPDEFELAVSLAGSLAIAARRANREVDLIVPEAIPEFDNTGRRSVRALAALSPRTLLDGLSGVDRLANCPRLIQTAELAGHGTHGLSVAFVVCGSTLALAELQSAALRFPMDVQVVAVVADLGHAPKVSVLGDLTVVRVPMLDDLRQLLIKGDKS
ncbi:DUF58 domain-containing protein [Rarobacter faecitabidus]